MGIPTQVKQMQPLGLRLTKSDPMLHNDYFTTINNYAYMNAAFSLKSWWWIITGMIPMMLKMFRRMAPLWRNELHPEYQAFVDGKREITPAQLSADEPCEIRNL
jgi:hypothetical protein